MLYRGRRQAVVPGAWFDANEPAANRDGIREGLPMPREPASFASGARMAKRSKRRESEAQDGRSERPAMGHGQPRDDASRWLKRTAATMAAGAFVLWSTERPVRTRAWMPRPD
jgi:hypothetical protein